MSADETPETDVLFEAKDIIRVLGNAGFDWKCEVCKSETWATFQEIDRKSLAITWLDRHDPSISDTRITMFLGLYCRTCSNTKLFYRTQFEKLLEDANSNESS